MFNIFRARGIAGPATDTKYFPATLLAIIASFLYSSSRELKCISSFATWLIS